VLAEYFAELAQMGDRISLNAQNAHCPISMIQLIRHDRWRPTSLDISAKPPRPIRHQPLHLGPTCLLSACRGPP